MIEPQALGATLEDWQHFDLLLGLGGDLLPVVPDPKAIPAHNSAIKQFGKIPSAYDYEGHAHGLAKWQSREITPSDIARWSKDPRLSMCVRSSAVRAIDVDVTDEMKAVEIHQIISEICPGLPMRYRTNAQKFLLAFRYPGPLDKRIITVAEKTDDAPAQRIELLADGQQFVAAGAHTSGVRYEWLDGLPYDIPTLEPEMLERIWSTLTERCALKSEVMPAARYSNEPIADTSAGVLDEFSTPADYAQLLEVLAYAPLLKVAAANDIWSEVGYALLSLGTQGYELFAKFSRAAPNYQPGDEDKWWSEHSTQIPRSDWRHIFTMARRLGWGAQAELSDFPVIAAPVYELLPETIAALKAESVMDAHHLCTDQKNAQRIAQHFGHRLRCVGGSFMWYTGTHWRRNEAEAARCVAHLSSIVLAEASAWEQKFKALMAAAEEAERAEMTVLLNQPGYERLKKYDLMRADEKYKQLFSALDVQQALEKWSKQCEMQPSHVKCLALLKSQLATDIALFDSAHHLFNCANGTLDLRTGVIHAHDPKDYITQYAPVGYRSEATCPRFNDFLRDVLDEERAAFLQRWFGYCITGETREQKLVLHIGEGSNGKGTLFRLLQATVGSYLHTAAPHLLTSSGGERHPTEIADLFGRRMVVSHESDEGASLREGFIKQASGEDQLSGRFMYKDFFTFTPAFKLQLLTNHKPQVKGSDFGIWRRLLLVGYGHKYGTVEEVASGVATRIGDPGLTAALLEEREGILAWLVDGSRQWYDSGLKPPAIVLAESNEYRNDQDRVRQFVNARCILDPQAWAPFSGGHNALYPAYTHWCKESGYLAMGINRFTNELKRVIVHGGPEDARKKVGTQYRIHKGMRGLMLNTDEDGGGFPIVESNNGDLL